jgi:hypothetical protein
MPTIDNFIESSDTWKSHRSNEDPRALLPDFEVHLGITNVSAERQRSRARLPD